MWELSDDMGPLSAMAGLRLANIYFVNSTLDYHLFIAIPTTLDHDWSDLYSILDQSNNFIQFWAKIWSASFLQGKIEKLTYQSFSPDFLIDYCLPSLYSGIKNRADEREQWFVETALPVGEFQRDGSGLDAPEECQLNHQQFEGKPGELAQTCPRRRCWEVFENSQAWARYVAIIFAELYLLSIHLSRRVLTISISSIISLAFLFSI